MGGGMLETVKEMFKSKKFYSVIGGTLVCAILTYAQAPSSLIEIVAGLTGAYVVGQGMADFGKNKPR